MIADFRELCTPGPERRRLTFWQWIQVAQAFGFDLRSPSAEVDLVAVGESIVLLRGGEPFHVCARAVWRLVLDEWKPAHLLMGKE